METELMQTTATGRRSERAAHALTQGYHPLMYYCSLFSYFLNVNWGKLTCYWLIYFIENNITVTTWPVRLTLCKQQLIAQGTCQDASSSLELQAVSREVRLLHCNTVTGCWGLETVFSLCIYGNVEQQGCDLYRVFKLSVLVRFSYVDPNECYILQ